MATDIYVAVESVLTTVDGQNVYITAGQTARAGHPILEGREALFEPFKVDYELGGDEEAEAVQPVEGDGLPKGNASRDEWAAYALGHGLTEEDLAPADREQLTRDEIRDHFTQA